MHIGLLGTYRTSWKVLLSTIKPALVKQEVLVQKTSIAIVKSDKAITDDVSLYMVRKVYLKKAFACVAFANGEPQTVPFFTYLTHCFR